MTNQKEYNIIFLGAGFSAPANLPLATKLWHLILSESKKNLRKGNIIYNLYENILKSDIENFIDFHNNSRNENKIIASEDEINLEEFISFLDIEEFLHLLGPDHWSEAGNQSQILIRNYIAKIIYQSQLNIASSQKILYDNFVSHLKPNDLIITFNYDTILEDAFERNNIPYRFYWERFKKINKDGSGEIDLDNNDIILHKMHGSIDWISDKYFVSKTDICIWNKNRNKLNPKCILPKPYFLYNEMKHIYRIKNLDYYIKHNEPVLESPFIISPSFNKLVYLNPLKELWNGFIGNGQFSKRVIFIGFSFPPHDDYIRQPLYYVVKNFELSASDDNKRISVIDYKHDIREQICFKNNYCFLNEEITDFYFDGFSENVINKIFD